MPEIAVSAWWPALEYWNSCGRLASDTVRDDLGRRVVVGRIGNDRSLVEVLGERRRLRLPFEPGRAPGISGCPLPVHKRPHQISQRQQIRGREDRGAGGRENVEHLELRRVGVIAPGHAEIAEDEL